MKCVIKYTCTIVCAIFVFAGCLNASSDLEIIRQRVVREMMQGAVIDARITCLMNNIREECTWTDINFTDVSNTCFQHGRHLNN